MNDNMIAAEQAPRPKIVESMQNIMKLPVERGNDWNVYAYTINKEPDDLKALLFPLGSFYDQDQAEKHAKSIMEKTQHPRIVIGQYGLPIKITSAPDVEMIEKVTMDMKGKIIEMENAEYKAQLVEYEKKLQYYF